MSPGTCIFPVERRRIWPGAEGHRGTASESMSQTTLSNYLERKKTELPLCSVLFWSHVIVFDCYCVDVPVKEVHECESWVGGEVEKAVSWAWELLCFSPSLPVNWLTAEGSPSESAQAQSSLLLESTQTQQDTHPYFVFGTQCPQLNILHNT